MAFDLGNRFVPGQVNQAGGIQVNYPLILQSQILFQFERNLLFKDLVEFRTGAGRATEITMESKLKARHRFPSELAEPLKSQNGNVAIQTVNIENMDYIFTLVSDWEQCQRTDSKGMELMDQRAAGLVSPLSERLDSALAIQISKGANASADNKPTLTHEPAALGYGTRGKVVVGAGKNASDVTGTELAKAINTFARSFDAKNIPNENRHVAVDPTDYGRLVNDATSYINRDLGGEGSTAKGVLPMISGVMVHHTNSLVKKNITASDTDWGSSGQSNPTATWANSMVVDNSKLLAIGWNRQGAVYCEWKPMASHVTGADVDLKVMMGGTMAFAGLTYGVKYLREAACCRIDWSQT